MRNRVIAVDFDGTLCVNAYPDIGHPKHDVMNYVRQAANNGAEIILWTNRTGKQLDEAVEFCHKYSIRLSAINENTKYCKRWLGDLEEPRKIFADEYLDDKNSTFCIEGN